MINTTQKGLITDCAPVKQPDGTWRYALNAITETREGDQLFLHNERGTTECVSLPVGYEILGSVYKNDDEFFVFSTDGTFSEIGKVSKFCEYTTIINNRCLDFSAPIDASYKLRRGCEDTVYFTDGVNPPRVINLSDVSTYLDEFGSFDCTKLDIKRKFTAPCIDILTTESGGSLEVGSYEIVLRYLDEDFNPTEFVTSRGPIRIFPQSSFTDYDSINGAFTDSVDTVNGVPPTTKSIVLNLSGLDQRFRYYQLGVLAFNSGNGIPTQIVFSPEIRTSVDTYAITDFEDWTNGSIEEIRLKANRIETAEHIEQIENRLILANTKGKQIDFCSLQQSTSQIITKYRVKTLESRDTTALNNAKHFDGNFQGFMGDEVYAAGVMYVFDDGTEIGPFHIPGRAKDTDMDACTTPYDDSVPVNPWTIEMKFIISQADWNLLSAEDKAKIEKWHVYDTSRAIDSESGYMQYYECTNLSSDADGNLVEVNSLYTSPDCVENYYGTDACGNVLEGTPIRHHRLPTRHSIPHYGDETGTNTDIRVFGMEFSNVTYPDPSIVSHYFVVGKRTEQNKTVLDKGWAFNFGESSGPSNTIGHAPQFQFNLGSNTFFKHLVSPKSVFEKTYVPGEFYRKENTYFATSVLDTDLSTDPFSADDNDIQYNLDVQNKYILYGDVQASTLSNVIIEAAAFIDRDTFSTKTDFFPDKFAGNGSQLNDQFVIRTDREWVVALYNTPNYGIDYVGIRVNRNVYDNLDFIQYYNASTCTFTPSDSQIIYGGDTVISHLGYADGQGVDLIGTPDDIYGFYTSLWVESTMNTSLRVGNFGDCTYFLNRSGGSSRDKYDNNEFYINSFADKENNGFKEDICPQYFKLNPDFSTLPYAFVYVPPVLDCCSQCQEEFPTRAHYSEQSFQEERVDNYRVFLPNNYRDIEGEHGEITAVWRHNENLFIHSKEALWQLPKNIQERSTGEIVSFIGTGEFFAIPPRKIIDDKQGTGGLQDKWSLIKRAPGVLWVDELESTVYLFDSSLKNISEGNRNWFENNLQSYLCDQFKRLGFDLPICGSRVLGVHSGYDPRHQRFLVTKIDYEVLSDGLVGGVTDDLLALGLSGDPDAEAGKLFYDSGRNSFATYDEIEQTVTLIEIGDTEWFENKSWTMSYSLLNQAWVSWHSYLPNIYINNKSHLFSAVDNVIHRHNQGTHQTFYGTYYPHIIEFVAKDKELENRVFEHIIIHGEAKQIVGNQTLDIRNFNFNKAILYNGRQSSGVLTLSSKVPQSQNYLETQIIRVPGQIKIDRNERDWYFNGFRDLVIDLSAPLFSSDWTDIQSQYPIDKVVNTSVIDVNKNWWELEKFRDKYLVVRLILDSGQNYRLSTHYVLSPSTISNR